MKNAGRSNASRWMKTGIVLVIVAFAAYYGFEAWERSRLESDLRVRPPTATAHAIVGGWGPDFSPSIGMPLLVWSAEHCSPSGIELALSKHANPNSPRNNAPLHLAALLGKDCVYREDIVRMLLKGGADPNLPYGSNMSALFLATKDGWEDDNVLVVRALLEGGADPNLSVGGSASPWSLRGYLMKQPGLLLFLEHGANPNAGRGSGGRGSWVLEHCMKIDAFSAFDLAIKKGADLNAEGQSGSSPLLFAVDQKRSLFLAHLLDNGADPNRPSQFGIRPLAQAVANDDRDAIGALLTRKANPNIPSVTPRYPLLQAAVNSRKREIVEELLTWNADPFVLVEFGGKMVPLIEVMHQGSIDSEMYQLLLGHSHKRR